MIYKYIDEKKTHLHTLGGKPLMGTTTILSVVAKPLTWWASGMACAVFGWLNPKTNTPEQCLERAKDTLETIKGFGIEEYQSLLGKAYKAHSEKLETSADEGTDMHSTLEQFVKDRMADKEAHLEGKLKCFEEWTDKSVKKFLASEFCVFSEKMWTGGQSDCLCELKNGEFAIVDFKSSKEAYVTQFLQVAGYDLQLKENGAFTENGERLLEPMTISKYIVVPFGAKEPYPVVTENVAILKEGFLGALALYKVINSLEK